MWNKRSICNQHTIKAGESDAQRFNLSTPSVICKNDNKANNLKIEENHATSYVVVLTEYQENVRP